MTYGVGVAEPVHALHRIDLEIADGAFVSLVGPSGCGKSTLAQGGRRPDGADARQRHDRRLRRRATARAGSIGLVFQQANLMPWLSIDRQRRAAAGSGGRTGGAPRQPARRRELLEVVGLTGFETKQPHQLSGGMQQRAALARALALDPAVLLMDEPFAALDEITRDRMAFELMRIWQHYRKTVLFVTHTLSEAVFLSDKVVLMSARPGRIHKVFDIDLPRPRERETRLQRPLPLRSSGTGMTSTGTTAGRIPTGRITGDHRADERVAQRDGGIERAWLSNSALLLVDMNRSHLDHSIGHMLVDEADANRIIARAVTVREAFAASGRPVIFVRTHHRQDPRTGEMVDNKSPFWLAQQEESSRAWASSGSRLQWRARRSRRSSRARASAGRPHHLQAPLQPVRQHRPGTAPANLRIDTLVIGGVNTNNCVLCSCFDAFNRDYRVILMEDVCASMNGEAYHAAALKIIEAALGWVINSDEIVAALRPARCA